MTERILNDRYALESKVGEGGMAVTYRARDLLLNRTVAVKMMREQFTTDPQFVERFRREAQAAARLSHENIASVYDTGRANGAYYIVMEFVEGTDLKQRLRRDGALPVLTALEFGRQIAGALDAAHRGGLVHRDVKPHNILINQDGKVKVTDFGIAKLASEGEDTGVIIGSVHYVSPEQARGEVTTPSSDLYSMGAVLFEMLTGRTVFEADNAMAVAHKQIYDRPPLPRTLRPEIPPAVESMVLRCLEKDPRARYQSAAELQAVLTQLIGQLAQEETIVITPPAPSMDATMVFRTPMAPPTTPATPVPPAVPNPRLPAYEAPEPMRGGGSGWLIALLLLLLALGVGGGAYWYLLKPSPAPPPSAFTVPVPNVIGVSDKETAISTLAAVGLRGIPKADYDEQAPTGQVFRQDPPAETPIRRDSTVTFWVSLGSATYLMPDVSGKALNDAKAMIRQLRGEDVKVEFVVTKEASPLPAGQVIRSEPAANTPVKRSVKVALVLSTGGEGTSVEETYNSTVPNVGSAMTMVRVEFERPAGSTPQLMWEGTLKPGDAIPEQSFQRAPNEKVIVRMLAGKDDTTLAVQEEKPFGPTSASHAGSG
ncbi:MAG TPA: Stk1 family PASTA domain-containing Ser/Thr kinase [Armatimonadota bacterium]|jgi:serine/threonine-protein kinase